MTSACRSIRARLDAFADGELESADRHRVTAHLERCRSCADALEEIRAIGDMLRARAVALPHAEFAGLASGVISRLRAEEAESWSAWFRRATDDWHWALVGSGSLVATLASVLIVAAICRFGVGGERADSLAGLISSLQRPAGTMVVLAIPVGRNQVPMLMQVNGPSDAMTRSVDRLILPPGFSGPSEVDLAAALSDALVQPDGRVGNFHSMPQQAREQTQAIFGELQRQAVNNVATWAPRPVKIQRLGFMTAMNVTAKPL